MRTVRAAFAAMLIGVACFLQQASATSFTTDQSDAWAVQGESGWGFLSFQRGSTIFGAIFVYDPGRIPIWYSGTLFYQGNFIWSGDLYLTSGPWFGTVPFNPNTVGYRRVGSITWRAITVTSGQLTYDVDGVSVVKNPTRFFVANDNYSGHYIGGTNQQQTGCLNPSMNGTFENYSTINVTHNGAAMSVAVFPISGGSCNYSGIFSQAGQMGSATGSFACTSGETGNFQFFEAQVTLNSFSIRYTANSNTFAGCTYTGYAVGMRSAF